MHPLNSSRTRHASVLCAQQGASQQQHQDFDQVYQRSGIRSGRDPALALEQDDLIDFAYG